MHLNLLFAVLRALWFEAQLLIKPIVQKNQKTLFQFHRSLTSIHEFQWTKRLYAQRSIEYFWLEGPTHFYIRTDVAFLLLRCLPVSINFDCTGFALVAPFSRGLILHTTLKSLHHDNKLYCKNFASLQLQPLLPHCTLPVNSARFSNSKTNGNQWEQKTNPTRNLNTSLFTLFVLT
jgi:hypothetical protein